MSITYFNGELLPSKEVALSIFDQGFVLGATITEQMRTFGAKLSAEDLDLHFERLERSLHVVQLKERVDLDRLRSAVDQVLAQNLSSLPEGSDLGVGLFVTPGIYGSFSAGMEAPGVTECVYTYRLAFARWADSYQAGQSLAIPEIHHMPNDVIPAEIKCRSRMHYVLADQAASRILPGSKALLFSREGYLRECSIANCVTLYEEDGNKTLRIPPADQVLPGVTLKVILQLAENRGWQIEHSEITAEQLQNAQEAWTTSTPYGVLPVNKIVDTDGKTLYQTDVANMTSYTEILSALNDHVGINLKEQAEKFGK